MGARAPVLDVIARGWDHPGWAGEFYPEDLPDAWRLGYYANVFRGVLVPAATLAAAGRDVIGGWVEDTHADFAFYLEWPATWNGAEGSLADRIGPLEGRVAGILWPAGAVRESVAGACAALRHLWDPAMRATGPALRAVWAPERPQGAGGEQLCCGCLGVASPAAACAPRALRSWLEAFLAWAGGCPRAALCLTGDPPPTGVLEQARVLADLVRG